jgi:alpha-galactosidase
VIAPAKVKLRGLTFELVGPLVDGVIDPDGATVRIGDGHPITVEVELRGGGAPLALGLRLAVTGARSYLRNGYQSWDGSYFVAPGTPAGDGPPAKAPTLGFATTALLPEAGGAVVLGADRHDRFQTRFRFGGTADRIEIDVETLLDGTGETHAETLYLFDGPHVEAALRRWSRRVAAASPTPPRLPAKRLTGWCSWYNHYAAIDAATISREIAAAAAFRDAHGVPLDIFQIDDGFTPEMGDWLDVRPTFPDGMAPLLGKAREAGFVPGLWVAPFLVGNRSKLAAEHPDWLVRDRATGEPLVVFHFHGEFRWHKRSEEYHVLDVTHPDAATYMAEVFRVWTGEWGARYLKCDFLLHGAENGPERARWHEDGHSRIAIYRRMMRLIRESVGEEVIVSGCGCPLWASVGLVDAVRIARDVGVTWHGEYSAESLLRDQQSRNHAHGILWQADPDCVLLRDRYHGLSDTEVDALARFAGGAGGVLMTSDSLDALPPARAALFAELLRSRASACDFPLLGQDGAVIEQRVRAGGRTVALNLFNPTDAAVLAPDGTPVSPHTLVSRSGD